MFGKRMKKMENKMNENKEEVMENIELKKEQLENVSGGVTKVIKPVADAKTNQGGLFGGGSGGK